MTIDEFKNGLVKYYGEHQSAHVTKVTLKYVESNYDKKNYPSLMQAIMKSHPFNYGFPDVAAVEEAQDKLWKKDGKSLRKTKTSCEWTGESNPLTEEEREAAEVEHAKFLEFTKKLAKDKTAKEDKKYCKDCEHFSKTKNTYNCRGCIDFSNYQNNE